MPDPVEVALWRFEQIAPLVDESTEPSRQRAALKERTTRRVAWPGGREKRISRSTLLRWARAYRRNGLAGLLPQAPPRAAKGKRAEQRATFIHYAIALLYEQPDRSLTQLAAYLSLEFEEYSLSRSSLARHLKRHPAYAGVLRLRSGKSDKVRALYEASAPHECWQLDGKGPFPVRLKDGTRIRAHVLTVLDDFSRAGLAARIAAEEDVRASVEVIQEAASRYGLPDRMQYDRGGAFDSEIVRAGLARCGVHRNYVRPRSAEWQGKVEAYHRPLNRWFVKELRAQEVLSLRHLQELLEAMLDQLYNEHLHREIGTSPKKRLQGKVSARRLSTQDLARAFYQEAKATPEAKTGRVKLPNGIYLVPGHLRARRGRFLYDPIRDDHAIVSLGKDHEVRLEPFERKPLPPPVPPERGTGQLQRLLDRWRGSERPNAQPGFGLPEVFVALSELLERSVPHSEREAEEVLRFYRSFGPLPREPFTLACQRAAKALGPGRPLSAYLDHLERQIAEADASPSSPSPSDPESAP